MLKRRSISNKMACTLSLMALIMLLITGCNGKKPSGKASLHKSSLIIKKEVFSPHKDMRICYSVISGFADHKIQHATNEKLKHLFFVDSHGAMNSQDELDSTFECDFEFEQSNHILIITQHGYYYEEGTVHGMPSLQIFHIDTQTGEFYHLRDLLNAENDLERIRIVLQEKFETKKQDLGYLVDTIPPITSNQVFKLTSKGIEIYFQLYEIACYADGFPCFEITWDEIGGVLNKERFLNEKVAML